MQKRTYVPKPMRPETVFKALMIALILGAMDDLENNTHNHAILSDSAMQACLSNGIPPEHQIAVMHALAELVAQVNIQTSKIESRGICPN